jgi:hypothetical protein
LLSDLGDKLAVWDIGDSHEDVYWTLCSTMAPWLNASDSSAEYGVFCDICRHNMADWDAPVSIAEAEDESSTEFGKWAADYPDPQTMSFMTLKVFEKHREEERAGLEVKGT